MIEAFAAIRSLALTGVCVRSGCPKLIFKALRRSGMSAIISKGWGELGVVEARLLPSLAEKLALQARSAAHSLGDLLIALP